MALVETTARRTFAPAAIISRFFEDLMNWNATRSTRKVLMNLTERELDDIGLNRADIEMMSFARAR